MRTHADHQPYRKKPYVARWYEGTRQRNKFFASAAARDEFIEQLKLTAQRQVGSPTTGPNAAHGGTNCLATMLEANYPRYLASSIISPPFVVPAIEEAPRLSR